METIRHSTEVTPEFGLHRVKGSTKCVLTLNGSEDLGTFDNEYAAKDAATKIARERKFRNAGLTEVFGRNRQWIQGPRGGWVRFKGV